MIDEKEFSEQIGKVVEEARKAAGLSRQQIADIFGVNNQSYIYAFERGAKLPLFRFFQLLQIFPPNVSKQMLEESLKLIDFPQDNHAENTLQQIRELLRV